MRSLCAAAAAVAALLTASSPRAVAGELECAEDGADGRMVGALRTSGEPALPFAVTGASLSAAVKTAVKAVGTEERAKSTKPAERPKGCAHPHDGYTFESAVILSPEAVAAASLDSTFPASTRITFCPNEPILIVEEYGAVEECLVAKMKRAFTAARASSLGAEVCTLSDKDDTCDKAPTWSMAVYKVAAEAYDAALAAVIDGEERCLPKKRKEVVKKALRFAEVGTAGRRLVDRDSKAGTEQQVLSRALVAVDSHTTRPVFHGAGADPRFDLPHSTLCGLWTWPLVARANCYAYAADKAGIWWDRRACRPGRAGGAAIDVAAWRGEFLEPVDAALAPNQLTLTYTLANPHGNAPTGVNVCTRLINAVVADGMVAANPHNPAWHEVQVFAHRRAIARRQAAFTHPENHDYYSVDAAGAIHRQVQGTAIPHNHIAVRFVEYNGMAGGGIDYHFHRRNADTLAGAAQWSDKNGPDPTRGAWVNPTAQDVADFTASRNALYGALQAHPRADVYLAVIDCGTVWTETANPFNGRDCI